MLQVATGEAAIIELLSGEYLEEQLCRHLEHRYLPDYLLYLGEWGAGNWLELDRSPQFRVAADLTDLLREHAASVVERFPAGASLVSIGTGSGEKERLVLEAMCGRDRPRYVCVDVSRRLVETALRTVDDLPIEKMGVVAFFEDLPVLRRLWRRPVVVAMLGNNFNNYDTDNLLDTVRAQLAAEDMFLFDSHLFAGRTEEIERVYQSEPNVRFNLGPLVRCGLDPEHCRFHLKLDCIQTVVGPVRRTRKWLEVLDESVVTAGGRMLRLGAGEIIRMGFTCKYTLDQIEAYLRRHALEVADRRLSRDGTNVLFSVRQRLAGAS